MPRPAGLAWCLALAVPLACGAMDLRGRATPEGLPKVEPKLDALEAENFQDKVTASRDRARAALARSQASAARTSATAMQVSQLAERSKTRGSVLNALLKGAETSSLKAKKASKASVVAVKSVEPLMKAFPQIVKEQAVQAVEKMFASKFDSLDSWRKETLDNRFEKGKRAAMEAQANYDKMLNVVYSRMQGYQVQANSLAAQANKAAADSASLAAGAEAKNQAGDIVGARQDMEMARALQDTSQRLSAQAQTIHGEATNMNKLIPEYVAAEQAAAKKAEFDANPEALPPPPMDPDFAFTPPPTR